VSALLTGCGPLYFHDSAVATSTVEAREQFAKADPAILFKQERERIERFNDVQVKAIGDLMAATLKADNLLLVDYQKPADDRNPPTAWDYLEARAMVRLRQLTDLAPAPDGVSKVREVLPSLVHENLSASVRSSSSNRFLAVFKSVRDRYRRIGGHGKLECDLRTGTLNVAARHPQDSDEAAADFASAQGACWRAAAKPTPAEEATVQPPAAP
jgi:hypothetical protein